MADLKNKTLNIKEKQKTKKMPKRKITKEDDLKKNKKLLTSSDERDEGDELGDINEGIKDIKIDSDIEKDIENLEINEEKVEKIEKKPKRRPKAVAKTRSKSLFKESLNLEEQNIKINEKCNKKVNDEKVNNEEKKCVSKARIDPQKIIEDMEEKNRQREKTKKEENNKTTKIRRKNAKIEDEVNIFPAFHKSKNITTMIYFLNNKLPRQTGIKCFWCRHNFEVDAIPIPLKHVDPKKKGSRSYYQEQDDKIAEFMKERKYEEKYYVVYGIFCSFPCAKAFLLDNTHTTARLRFMLRDSNLLLTKLFKELTGRFETIPSAPHWELLKDYGGHLSIEDFRKGVGNITYEDTLNTKRPDMFMVGRTYLESRQNII